MQIKEIIPNSKVELTALITDIKVQETKSGKPYIRLTLGDKTGEIEAIKWDCDNTSPKYGIGTVVTVDSRSQEYNGSINLTINSISVSDKSPNEFLRDSGLNVEGMEKLLRQIIEEISDKAISELVTKCIMPKLDQILTHPAAKSVHHAFVGGLVQHMTSVAYLCIRVVDSYPHWSGHLIDRDALIAGALLHDIGKLAEYKQDIAIEMTDEGYLIGHLAMGYHYVKSISRRIDGLDPEKLLKITHLIVSHHGNPEWGTIKEPQTAEAVILHQCDMIDSHVQTIFEAYKKAPKDATWTNPNSIRKQYYIGGLSCKQQS